MQIFRNFFYVCLVCGLGASGAAIKLSALPTSISDQPTTPLGWFERANDQMNLRLPDAAPFHMKVTFRAFQGAEILRPNESPQIVVGDGIYEETWLAPHVWRREVTLANYQAVEVENDRARKMQASSDYEPSRVLMLLSALLSPIPRDLAWPEPRSRHASGWSIAPLTTKGISLVRISESTAYGDEFSGHTAYYFLPDGRLTLKSDGGVSTIWDHDVLFAGKTVPTHLTIGAAGLKENSADRVLLSADVIIEAANKTNPENFDLVGDHPANPGTTLRPLQGIANSPQPLGDPPQWPGGHNAAIVVWGVIDRTGNYRELEVTLAVNAEDLHPFIEQIRRVHFRPAEIDKSRCEVTWPLRVMRENHTNRN